MPAIKTGNTMGVKDKMHKKSLAQHVWVQHRDDEGSKATVGAPFVVVDSTECAESQEELSEAKNCTWQQHRSENSL